MCGGDATGQIFINYRRADSAGYARSLYDRLSGRFGSERLFMDLDNLAPGVDFVDHIHDALGSVDALVAVIGPRWLSETDTMGGRRLDDPDDFVRVEIVSALEREDVTVIPVLVGGASMPPPDQLPPDLAPLTRRNALDISDQHWNPGVRRLIETLERVVSEDTAPVTPPVEEEPADEEAVPLPPAEGLRELPVIGVAAFLGAAFLVLGTALRFDSYIDPDFGPASVDSAGLFVAPAPFGVALGVLGALILARRGNRLGYGLLLGFAVAAAAKHVGALGVATATEIDEDSILVTGSALAALGAFVVLLAALRVSGDLWRRTLRPMLEANQAGAVSALAGLGGLALLVAIFIDFNGGGPGLAPQTIWGRNDHWEALEPVAAALAAGVAGLLVLTGRPFRPPAGILIGLGIAEALLALRYIGVPVVQPDTFSSFGLGGVVLLSGAVLLVAAGLSARSWGERDVAWRRGGEGGYR